MRILTTLLYVVDSYLLMRIASLSLILSEPVCAITRANATNSYINIV